MGVVNVTPDSFSDGGRFYGADDAIREGLAQRSNGADIVDVGGESTRPGATEVSADEERRRIVPVITELVAEGVLVSVDTSKPSVASAAIDAGAVVVNDVSGFRADGMAEVCAAAGVGVVLMHMQGDPRTMQLDPTYKDVVSEVRDYLESRIEHVVGSGVDANRVAIDPGIGFGKTLEHNLELLNGLPSLSELGMPVLVGTSRKGFSPARSLGDLQGNAMWPAPCLSRQQSSAERRLFASTMFPLRRTPLPSPTLWCDQGNRANTQGSGDFAG